MAWVAPLGGAQQIVGRELEFLKLREFLDADHLRALVLTGGPGIGKTTLWEGGIEAATQRGSRVLSARPNEAEARLPLAALADLLEQVESDVLRRLPPPQRHALEVALLRAEPIGLPPEPRAIASGFLQVLRALVAQTPLVVAIDDIQWLDLPSADALTFAVRRLQDDAIGFLLTERSGIPSGLVHAFAPQAVDRIEVSGLSLGAIRRILTQRLSLSLSRRSLRRLFESTQGNPLFALEIGRMLVARGSPDLGDQIPIPSTLEALLGVRVAGLAGPVRRVLLAVALGGDGRTMQSWSQLDWAAVDAALDAGLLLQECDRLRVVHPLLSAAAKAMSSPSEQRALHSELALVAEDEELRARHLALAASDPDEGVAAVLATAATRAAARGTAESAAELADDALRLTPPQSAEYPDRLLDLVQYLMIIGEERRAKELLVGEVNRLPAGRARARAHLLLADRRWAAVHLNESLEHFERALTESHGDPGLHAVALARKSRYVAVARLEQIREAEAWVTEAWPEARLAGPEAEREVLHGLAWVRILRGRPIDDLQQRFRAISADGPEILRSLERAAAERHAHRGEVNEARTILSRLLVLSEERGEYWSYSWILMNLCEVELRAGEWAAAMRLLEEWIQSADGEPILSQAYARYRALLAAGRGFLDEAERWAEEAIADTDESGSRWHVFEVLWARGTAAMLLRSPEKAVGWLRGIWEHTQREGVEDPGIFPVAPDLVEALVELAEIDAALAVTDRLAALAAEQDHPWGLATAQRCRALVQFATDAEDEAVSGLMNAAAQYGTLGLRFDRARSFLILGRAERRRRRWAAARNFLDQAASAFEGIGSPGWAEQARAELARLGARRPGPPGALTATEQRVAELATDGLSNKEIARTLFVSVHTVEVHLSHAYAKIGVHSRAQLARRLPARR